jgi:exopolyphosphatase/guanosine-5'-triphosphate,3'-diphosphate pyrophosphatase
VRGACIDIGSNTTRLLVADCDGERLFPVLQERVFTHIGHAMQPDGAIAPDKIAEVAQVVAGQVRQAQELTSDAVRAVATAAIRRAANGSQLVDAIRASCGIEAEILSCEDEARLAFVGAARTLGRIPRGPIGVVDVGGGSSELVVGIAPDQVSWSASFALGSGDLARTCMPSDPPSSDELAEARRHVAGMLEDLDVPQPDEAVAVGGSAASLCRLAGARLDREAFDRCLSLLVSESAASVAARFGLHEDRVRLLPAGLLILEAAAQRLGTTLQVANGGLREGVLFEECRG